tara:strand:+ start:341 stop:574 length:234 start_codon:yes stop_codon:yes gene_type:complete
MVLSTTKKTSSISSITNQNQGGGDKKAGLVPTETASVATTVAYNVRGLPKSLNMMTVTANPNVRQSRPIGIRPLVWN